MAKIPEPAITTASMIDAHHESRQDKPRPHMGASQIGHKCERHLWLGFRWVKPEKFKGRILRLFRRGNNEEETIIQDLRAIGVDVKTTTGGQDRVDFGNHVSGSMDGIANYGIPEAPKKKHVLEFKTHSKKSFDDLEKHGLAKSKPIHYAQCQVYMLGTGIDRALYLAVCKDDDRIYTERVKLEKKEAQRIVDRAHRIVGDPRLPPPISTDETWFECRFCSHHAVCHKQALPEINCRTCAHSTPMPDSTWRCERHDADNIPTDFQRTGCDQHAIHPDLVPWPVNDAASTEWEPVFIINGKDVKNGVDGYRSREIVANPQLCAERDPVAEEFRINFDAEIVG